MLPSLGLMMSVVLASGLVSGRAQDWCQVGLCVGVEVTHSSRKLER